MPASALRIPCSCERSLSWMAAGQHMQQVLAPSSSPFIPFRHRPDPLTSFPNAHPTLTASRTRTQSCAIGRLRQPHRPPCAANLIVQTAASHRSTAKARSSAAARSGDTVSPHLISARRSARARPADFWVVVRQPMAASAGGPVELDGARRVHAAQSSRARRRRDGPGSDLPRHRHRQDLAWPQSTPRHATPR